MLFKETSVFLWAGENSVKSSNSDAKKHIGEKTINKGHKT